MTTEQEALRLASELPWVQHTADWPACDAAAAMLRKLVAEREEQQRELIALRARLDRAINAAQEHFGEDAIRYKFSLMTSGRTRNKFPRSFDGKWFALQRADNDAHIGLCDRINQLEAERDEHRAVMRLALEALEAICGWQSDQGHHKAAITDLRRVLGETT